MSTFSSLFYLQLILVYDVKIKIQSDLWGKDQGWYVNSGKWKNTGGERQKTWFPSKPTFTKDNMSKCTKTGSEAKERKWGEWSICLSVSTLHSKESQ